MLKRVMVFFLVLLMLAGNVALAIDEGVDEDYPRSISISLMQAGNDIKLNFGSTNTYLGWYENNPLLVINIRDPFSDVQMPDFFTAYSASEYLEAFNVLKPLEPTNYLKDIGHENIKKYFKSLCDGNVPLTYGDELSSVYLKDRFLIAALDEIASSPDITQMKKEITALGSLLSYVPGQLFFNALEKVNDTFLGVKSLQEARDVLDRKRQAAGQVIVSEFTDKIILEKYVNPITVSTVSSMEYGDIEKILYALSWDELYKHPAFDIIRNAVSQNTTSQQDLLTIYWQKVVTDFVAYGTEARSDSLIQLATIVHGRGSMYSRYKFSDWVIPAITKDTEIDSDQNAANSAMQDAKNILDKLSSLSSSATTEDQQYSTISLRLQYHYHAMQALTTPPEGSVQINQLSETEDGAPFDRAFAPLHLPGIGIAQQSEYIRFMNVVNEVPLFRQVVDKSGVTVSTSSVNEFLRIATSLQQVKGAVTFLESLPYSDTKEVATFWYESDSTLGGSLEELYQKMVSLGVSDSELDGEIPEADVNHPLAEYFSFAPESLRPYLKMGIAQSALFVPLQTNVYEPYAYTAITNENFYSMFHSIWGYHRKALYIDTALSSAVNLHNTGQSGQLRPATLRDLLSPEKDIVLYSDTAFYNANRLESIEEQVSDVVDSAKETAEQITGTAEGVGDVVTGKWDKVIERGANSIGTLISDIWSDVVESVSATLTPYSATLAADWKMAEGEDKVLTGPQIQAYLADPNYSELKTLAVQSAILRDKELVQYIKKSVNLPVFVSSPDLCLVKNITQQESNSFFNYLLLKNIGDNAKVEYKSTMDYNSPVYMDVYGNILTESGYVVIPAMANATLQKTFFPYTTAFIGSYGSEYKASAEYASTMNQIESIVQLTEDEKSYEFKTTILDDVIDFQHFSENSEDTQRKIYSLARLNLEKETSLNMPVYVTNCLLQVMRGAPMEHIDKEAEGIASTNADTSKAGVVQAVKLDQLKEALNTSSQNSVLSIPNLAFMSGIEYVILFVYKLSILVVIILIFIQIFSMAMTNSFNVFSILKILTTIMLTITIIFAIPVIYETTYYQTNKAMLQDETLYIAMLNLEKEQSGMEIGMTDVTEPKIDTKLYLKMQSIDVPWTELFGKVITSSVDKNFSKIYSEYARSNLAFGLTGFEARGNGLYMDVQTLFSSSDVVFNPEFKTIYQYVKQDNAASFYTPYYVFLDALTENTNKYNEANHMYSYTTSIYKGGRLKSIGLAKDYLTSDVFLLNANTDNLCLNQIYGVSDFVEGSIFMPEDVVAMQRSEWCNTDMTAEEISIRIEKMNEFSVKFINDNKELLGRISDESFLKVMALALAMEHNKLFGVGAAQSLEIYNLAPDDLVRLSILPKEEVMLGSPYSYSRYIFENVGTVGIYLAAILDLVLFVGGWVKPAITVLLFVTLYLSIFVNRLVLRKDSDNIKGYIKLVVILCLSNLFYSVTLKLSTMLPDLGLPPAVCLIALIVFHMTFIGLFIWVTSVALRNWRDLGNSKFEISQLQVKEFLIGNSIVKKLEERLANPTNRGWELYSLMHKSDAQRVYKIEREDDI